VAGRALAPSESVRVVDEPPMSRTAPQTYSPSPANHSLQEEEVPPRQPSPIRLNRSAHAASTSPLNPVADAFEDDDCFEATVELPGVNEADIDVEFADGAITVTAERRRAEGGTEMKYLVRERSYGTFKRRFALPFQANPDIIEAAYLDGIVTVRALRPPETKPRTKKIELKRP
jgi:HSP20 family protein